MGDQVPVIFGNPQIGLLRRNGFPFQRRSRAGGKPLSAVVVVPQQTDQVTADHAGGVGAKAKTAAVIKLVDRPQQRVHSLAQQVIEPIAGVGKIFGDGHHQPDVSADDAIPDLHTATDQIFDVVQLGRVGIPILEVGSQHVGAVLQVVHLPKQEGFLIGGQ